MLRLAGLEIGENTYIGSGVFFDGLYPHLTNNWQGLYNHFWNENSYPLLCSKQLNGGVNWIAGQVIIGDGCFIGMNTIICKSVTIGDNSVIGAGSIVTKDIPANELWASNPARFIRKL